MNVYIDDTDYSVADMPGATIGQVVERIRQTADVQHQVIVGLRCDGLDVSGADLTGALERPLADIERLDVQTGSPAALVIDALDEATNVLDGAAAALGEIVADLNTGQLGRGMGRLAESFRDWLQVHDAIGNSLAMLNIDAETLTIDGQSAAQIIRAPLELLTQVRDVVQARDHVQLADILQYEFESAISGWRKLAAAIVGRARGQ